MKPFLPFLFLMVGFFVFGRLARSSQRKLGLNTFSGTRALNRAIYGVVLSIFFITFFTYWMRNTLNPTQFLWGFIGSLIVGPLYILWHRSYSKKRLRGAEYVYEKKDVSVERQRKTKNISRIMSVVITIIIVFTYHHFGKVNWNILNPIVLTLGISFFWMCLYWLIELFGQEKKLGKPIMEMIKDSDNIT